MKENINEKLLAWHRSLLNEASGVAYRIADNGIVTDNFLEDLAFALESLSVRVRREKKGK